MGTHEQPPLDPEKPEDNIAAPGSEDNSSETGTTPSDAPKIDPEYTDAQRLFDIPEKDMPEFFELYKSHRILRQAFFDNIQKFRPDQLLEEQQQIMTEALGALNEVAQSFERIGTWFFEDKPEDFINEISRLFYEDVVDAIVAARVIIPAFPGPFTTLEELKDVIKQTRDDYIRIHGGSFDIQAYVAFIKNSYANDLNGIAVFTFGAIPCREAAADTEQVADPVGTDTVVEPTDIETDYPWLDEVETPKQHALLREIAKAALTACSIALGIIIGSRFKKP